MKRSVRSSQDKIPTQPAGCVAFQGETIVKQSIRILLSGCLLLVSLPFAASADEPGRHPSYLHALSDLRTARWLIARRTGDPQTNFKEDRAIGEIDAAINDIKQAAIADGKDLRYQEPTDAPGDRPGRLHQALDLLRAVHSDVAQQEDDPRVRGLRDDAVGHIDYAFHEVEHAVHEMESRQY